MESSEAQLSLWAISSRKCLRDVITTSLRSTVQFLGWCLVQYDYDIGYSIFDARVAFKVDLDNWRVVGAVTGSYREGNADC